MMPLAMMEFPFADSTGGGDHIIHGSGTATIQTCLDHPEPWYNGTPLPRQGFPFKVDGQWYQRWVLPCDPHPHHSRHCFKIPIHMGQEIIDIQQDDMVGRPEIDAVQHNYKHLDTWLNWQVQRYQELAHVDKTDGITQQISESFSRTSWQAVYDEWLKEGGDAPKMALIVKLAGRKELISSLATIAKQPRRILQRVRTQVPLHRVREMDSACIRDYARRPGITMVEKAGSKQRILALVREEIFNTLENQVALWVARQLIQLGQNYCGLYDLSSSDPKSQRILRVKSLMQWSHQWVNDLQNLGIGNLTNPPHSPNYSLQFDENYRQVWKAYSEIRKQLKVLDEAWTWQRVMWGNTCRQILYSYLLHGGNEEKTPNWTECQNWTEAYVSSAVYMMDESRFGRWQWPPFAPGPFKVPKCHIIDSWDCDRESLKYLSKKLPFMEHIGSLGSDIVLIKHKEFGFTVLCVWTIIFDSSNIEGDNFKNVLAKLQKRVGKWQKPDNVDLQCLVLTMDQKAFAEIKVDEIEANGIKVRGVSLSGILKTKDNIKELLTAIKKALEDLQ